MHLFLSWSGEPSRSVAAAFDEWIPLVLQRVKPFISSGDIDKGQRWSDVIGNELNKAGYGIIFVTRSNCAAPWLHFESGAVSKAIEQSFVSPLLFNVEPADIAGPLAQFQFTLCTKDDIWQLIRSINRRFASDEQLADTLLKREFEAWWPDLETRLEAIRRQDDSTHTAYPWLYTVDDLHRVLRVQPNSQVWWITPNAYSYALQETMRTLVRHQIEREGVTYTFVMPRTERSDAADRELIGLASRPGAMTIVKVDVEDFYKNAVTDYVVTSVDSDNMRVFIELPLPQPGFWAQVAREAAGRFVGRFRQYTAQARTADTIYSSADTRTASLVTTVTHVETVEASVQTLPVQSSLKDTSALDKNIAGPNHPHEH